MATRDVQDFPANTTLILTIRQMTWLKAEAERRGTSLSEVARTVFAQAIEASEQTPAAVAERG